MAVSYQYQHDVFARIKLLHLRALFWERVNNQKKKYDSLHKFPLQFFLQFKPLLDNPYYFTVTDIDNILKVSSDQYNTPGNVEYYFDDFKDIFFMFDNLTINDFLRIKKFFKSSKRRIYTLVYIRLFIRRVLLISSLYYKIINIARNSIYIWM